MFEDIVHEKMNLVKRMGDKKKLRIHGRAGSINLDVMTQLQCCQHCGGAAKSPNARKDGGTARKRSLGNQSCTGQTGLCLDKCDADRSMQHMT